VAEGVSGFMSIEKQIDLHPSGNIGSPLDQPICIETLSRRFFENKY
jgi:hypothetical protein